MYLGLLLCCLLIERSFDLNLPIPRPLAGEPVNTKKKVH